MLVESLFTYCPTLWMFHNKCKNTKIGRLYEVLRLVYEDYDSSHEQLVDKNQSLRKMCPYSECFWSVFSHIRTECGAILRISPY